MMLQAASRGQSVAAASHHQHHQQPQASGRGGGGGGVHGYQRGPRFYPAAKAAPSGAVAAAADYATYEDSNARSGRFASALLFMAVLVLMVDASRIILYSWYTDGSYLKYLYGSEAEIRWPKCGGSLAADYDLLPSLTATTRQPPSTPTAIEATVVITAMSQRLAKQQQEQQLDQFKDGLMHGLTMAGQLLDAAVGDSTAPLRRVPKPLVRVLFHASTVACLFFLAVAIFPAALRSHRGRCLLLCSLLFSFLTVAAAGASATASLLSVYYFSACELQPRVRRVYDFVPDCDALRRAFLGAECFSLIVVCSSVCILLHLKAYFCRALCAACGCCQPGDGGVGDWDGDGGVGGRNNERLEEFGRPCRPYDEEEYLA